MSQHSSLYKGYSTFEFEKNKSLRLTDVELVKMDILNHIFTTRGSRVMMPNFGSIIPELAFEPLDELLVDDVYSELQNIFNYDPRVAVISLTVVPNFDTNVVFAVARLRYIELNITDNFELNIQFES